jgi:hypothetical protein
MIVRLTVTRKQPLQASLPGLGRGLSESVVSRVRQQRVVGMVCVGMIRLNAEEEKLQETVLDLYRPTRQDYSP